MILGGFSFKVMLGADVCKDVVLTKVTTEPCKGVKCIQRNTTANYRNLHLFWKEIVFFTTKKLKSVLLLSCSHYSDAHLFSCNIAITKLML